MRFSYSLIICCYNSATVIGPTIKAICDLEHDQDDIIELIVVDNNCTDNTINIIYDAWTGDLISLTVVKEPEPGLMHARRKGVQQVKNDIVVFIDDDNILEPHWLRILDGVYVSNQSIGCVGGMVKPMEGAVYPDWFEQYQGVYACGKQADKSMIVSKTRMTMFGAGLSFRTHVIQGIFNSGHPLFLTGRTKNTLLRGDDSELCMRTVMAGYDAYYSEELVLQHNILSARVTWDYVKKARYGGGIAETVLSMYRAINMGQEPRDYIILASSVISRWWKLLKRLSSIRNLKEPGTCESFEFHFLKGQVKGLFIFHPLRYARIRKELLEIHSEKKHLK